MPKIRVALIQCEIIDLDVEANLLRIKKEMKSLQGRADLVVFPESITTGFSNQGVSVADEWAIGEVLSHLVSFSKSYGLAISGSYFVQEGELCYNRFFLIDQDFVQYQDKRHLFSLGGEPDMVAPAKERKILSFRGWRILPVVCYDLRFPVWCRCLRNDYDMIICVANWPKGRRSVWSTLLKARAMENLSYVIGVNRVGRDAMGLDYLGDSAAIDPRGRELLVCEPGNEQTAVVELDYAPLAELREKFPVWKDADVFTLD